ncbi:MAG: DUF115 domain-containing protein [Candidatus Heimdallarchaeota archaeon]
MQQFVQLSKKDYLQICSLLDIDPDTDLNARKSLHEKVNRKNVKTTLKELSKRIKDKTAIIFGAGPSLVNDISDVSPLIRKYPNEIVVIAVDGAVKALLECDLKVDIVVTDLDGSIPAIRESHTKNAIIIIHAHGDNIPKVNSISDLLPKMGIIGTTQTTKTSKVWNLGGFTDGDRAVYTAANMYAKRIVLFGFDFGKIIGRYSKPENYNEDFPASENKLIKFKIAKKLLAQLPEKFLFTEFFQYTEKGEKIENILQIGMTKLKEILNVKH